MPEASEYINFEELLPEVIKTASLEEIDSKYIDLIKGGDYLFIPDECLYEVRKNRVIFTIGSPGIVENKWDWKLTIDYDQDLDLVEFIDYYET